MKRNGFSLIELMVSTAIGLLAIMAIGHVFSVFEGQKRTTMAGGEAQTNGAMAVFAIEREIRMAGYGINMPDLLGCKILGWDSEDGGGTAFELQLVPVVITADTNPTANGSDIISLMFGDGVLAPIPASIMTNMPSPAATYKVSNRFGFREGDLVIAAEPGKDCTLAQVSNVPNDLGDGSNVIHNAGTYTDPWSNTQIPTRYNKPGGLGVAYNVGAKLFNLGDAPTSNTYYVEGNQLFLQENLRKSLGGFIQSGIFSNIVHMRAMYGKDTDDDGTVDVYDSITPTTPQGWASVYSVRLGVVSQAGVYEKDIVSPATVNVWSERTDVPTIPAVEWTLTTEQQHYRYKTFSTLVPIRNMIWRP